MSAGARARGGRPTPGAGSAEPLDDAGLLFRRLEQAGTEEADQIKELFRDNLRLLAGEAWLLNGLIDYYVSTGSARCLEILLSCEEANSRSLIDRLHQLLKTTDQRAAGLRLLGYYVRKHPVWLRKVVTQTSPCIVGDLFRIIRHADCEVQCVISAVLVITTLMPMFPVALIDHIHELFHVLSRLTQLVSAPPPLFGAVHQRHLHVAVYSYFVRLYAMYPCNLLSFLRQHYGQRDRLPVFNGTIRPLLDHVRMHPLLVTGSNSTETSAQRWTRKETHDIVAECAHFSLDVLEASPMDNLTGPLWPPAPADAADSLTATDVGIDGQEPFGIHEILWSPAAAIFGAAALRPLPVGDAGDAPPPETAVEATPDTTPAPTPTLTPLKELDNPPLQRQPPAPAGCVTASRALAALVTGAVRPRATGSSPSSPAKKPPAAFRFSDGDSAQAFNSRLGQVVRERADSGGGETERRSEESAPTPLSEAGAPPRGLRDRRTSGKLSPIKLKLGVVSPVQFSDGAPAVTRPVPRGSADGAALSGGGGGLLAVSPGLWQPQELVLTTTGGDHSAEDQEVSDLTRRGSAAAAAAVGSLTPFASTTAQLTQQLPAGQPPTAAAAAPAAIPGARAAAAAAAAAAAEFDDDSDGEDEGGLSPGVPLGLAASVPQSRFDFDLVRHMTRYYSQHVLPGRLYRSTSSCPDLAAAAGGTAAAAEPVAGGAPLAGPRADAAAQTEDGPQPAPYEHLLAGVLPPPPPVQVSVSPHQRLRDTTAGQSGQCDMLHELLEYERYKREVHAHRNRRLFDRTRATRRLEEESRELKKQVQIMSVDVAECRRQLQLVKRAAARAAEEHVSVSRRLQAAAADGAGARQQLAAQLAEQQLAAAELARQLAERDDREQQLRRELLETSRELSCAREKAARKAELEARVLDLERRLLVMGHLQPAASPPVAAAPAPAWPPLPVAPPAGGGGDEARRRAETAALEDQLRERDLTVAELRRLIELMSVKHHEQMQALDERYSAVKEHLQSAHTQLLLCPPAEPLLPPEPGCSNGGPPPAAKPAAAGPDPGLADLRASIGRDGN